MGLQVAAADEAKCDNDSDICCSEKEITQECSDYALDGYKCASTCYDVPQDFPSPDERKTIISPFLPKVLQSIIFPEEPSIPPVDLYLIFEKSICKNQVRRTGFLVYFDLKFYCL